MDKIRSRAEQLLARAEVDAARGFQEMFSEQIAMGGLGNGRTIIRAVEIYSGCMTAALTQMQSEISNQIDHRGKKWHMAIDAVQSALLVSENRSREVFIPIWNVVRANGSAIEAGSARIAAAFETLRAQVSEFGEGWTAPTPKKWNERHPVLYGALSALGGSLLTIAASHFTQSQQPASAPVPTAQPSPRPASSQSPSLGAVSRSHDQAQP